MTPELLDALRSPNMRAFLRVIRAGETSQTDDAYRMMFGGELFTSFDAHPNKAITRGSLTSTAAGAYQFLSRTWRECQEALGLPDFSPQFQDLAAVFLIRRRGALADVLAGRIQQAIAKCAKEWASLPGSPYGQPTKTMAQALATYAQYGGVLYTSPEPAQKPAESVHVAQAPQPEANMPPLIAALGQSLISIFAPLAAEKIQREIGRHTDNPEIAEQVATAAVEAAKAATGLSDPIEAVAAAKTDPAVMAKVEQSALDRLSAMAPALNQLAELEAKAWAAEEASRDSARQHNADDPLMIDAPWLKLKFIHILSLALVGFSGWFVTENWGGLTPELKGAVITLMIIAGWNGVKDYWMGSSRSSAAKDVVIGELSKRKAGP